MDRMLAPGGPVLPSSPYRVEAGDEYVPFRRRRSITNTDGRITVEGYPGWSTSDRTLAEYVAAELDRVDPL